MEKSKEKTSYYDKKPVLGEPGSLKIKEHFRKGITAFLVVAACIVCYFTILRFDYIADVLSKIAGLIRPVIYGIVIAYLINPIVTIVEKCTIPLFKRFFKKEKAVNKTARGLGILIALFIMAVLIAALLNMVVPELIKSIKDLVNNLPGQITKWVAWGEKVLSENTTINEILRNVLHQGSEALESWIKTDLFQRTNQLVTGVTSGVISIVSGVLDLVIGVIVSVYALNSKEQFLGQGRKIIYALLSPKHANLTLHIMRKSNDIFGGFIIGKIIDSAIIGVLCFVGVTLLKMPYALLVSVFVGVTNVIPYFGPFIGAIPSTILIMLVDPIKGFYFIIFILLLQQFDGNIIGPTILGDTTGLSAFWVLFSILLFGGMFGVVGMIIGVPTFAVFYYVVNLFITHRLEEKNLPAETSNYNGTSYVDDDGNYIQSAEKHTENIKLEEKEGE